jgi:hypothetical protein
MLRLLIFKVSFKMFFEKPLCSEEHSCKLHIIIYSVEEQYHESCCNFVNSLCTDIISIFIISLLKDLL